MKLICEQIGFEDGEWWYRISAKIRQRAQIKSCETCGDQFATYPTASTRFCSPECWRRPCKRCDEIFQPRTKRTEYCSPTCKQKPAICENCSKAFFVGKGSAGRFCAISCGYEFGCPIGSIRDGGSGYTIIKVPVDTVGTKTRRGTHSNNWMWEHRYVMQSQLGRPLEKYENVHHINGKRDDNRPENLELWKRSQPAGVRSGDYHCAGCHCLKT